jgi:effector-binding domain-containing protein
MNLINFSAILFVATIAFSSCGENTPADASKSIKIDTAAPKAVAVNQPIPEAEKPAIINITDTVATKQMVLCFKDSAATMERISAKLAIIYGTKVAEVLKKNNIKPNGAPIAWYKSEKAPYFFEAGIPVAKRPAKMPSGAFIKDISGDSAIIAHFYGPYALLNQGYTAVKEFMKDAKRVATAPPYEIYIGDPMDSTGKPIDPYKVRTDIVFPRK